MLKPVLYGVLGLGTVAVTSICDLCKPGAASAAPAARTASAPPAVIASPAPAAAAVAAVSAPAGPPKVARFKVAGMTCGGCVIGTRAVLTRLPGVTKADVSYERGEAVVTYDPDKVTVAQMVAAVKTLGYTATPVAG